MQRTSTLTMLGMALLFAALLQAQPDYRVFMKDTAFWFPENLKVTLEQPKPSPTEAVSGFHFRLLQFQQIPTAAEHLAFQQEGVQLLEYITNFTYLAAIPSNFNWQKLNSWKVRGVLPISSEMKKARSLYERPFPGWAVQGDQLDVIIKYFKPLAAEQVVEWCKTENIKLVRHNGINNYLRALIPISDMDRIAALPCPGSTTWKSLPHPANRTTAGDVTFTKPTYSNDTSALAGNSRAKALAY